MAIKAILFDLDGTLLPMVQEEFIECYFKLLAKKLVSLGYGAEHIVESVWKSVGAMMKNDGSCKNEDAFWNTFAGIYGEQSKQHKSELDSFYRNEFSKVREVCGFHPAAKEVVELVREKGLVPVLATNPLFPAVATQARMSWAGLTPVDFDYYTTYENATSCKPNPKYYEEILDRIGCKPEECVMVGNDVQEDMVVEALGMKVFLLTDCLINKKEVDISVYPRGSFEELKKYIAGIC